MYVHFVNDQTNHKQILNNWHVIDVILTFQKLNPCMKILITLQMSLLMNKSVLTGHYFNVYGDIQKKTAIFLPPVVETEHCSGIKRTASGQVR